MLGNISLFTVLQCYFKHLTDINTSLIYLPAWLSRDTRVDDSWFQLCVASRAISLSLSPGSVPCFSGCPGALDGFSHPPRPRTPAQVPCYLEPPLSLQTQAGYCPLVQETGPGLPCLLNREGPSPWEEVGARGRKWVAKEQRTCLSSGGRPASSHRRVKTLALK